MCDAHTKSGTALDEEIVVGGSFMNFGKITVADDYEVAYGEKPVTLFRLHDISDVYRSNKMHDYLSTDYNNIVATMGSTIEFTVKNEKGVVVQKLYINDLKKNMIKTGVKYHQVETGKIPYDYHFVPIPFGKDIGLDCISIKKSPENDPQFISFGSIYVDPTKLSSFQTKGYYPRMY